MGKVVIPRIFTVKKLLGNFLAKPKLCTFQSKLYFQCFFFHNFHIFQVGKVKKIMEMLRHKQNNYFHAKHAPPHPLQIFYAYQQAMDPAFCLGRN